MESKTIPQTMIRRTGLKGCRAHVFHVSPSTTNHIFPSIPQKKDLWRFLWDYVEPQEESNRNQDHWQCPVCVCCLACSRGHRKLFICPSVKKPPLPPKHPWTSPICHEGKCLLMPNLVITHLKQQVGAWAHPAWYPLSYRRWHLLLQKEARRNYLKTKQRAKFSIKEERKNLWIFGLCMWPAETWSLTLMWHNLSHEQQRSHLLSVLIRRSKYEIVRGWWLKH